MDVKIKTNKTIFNYCARAIIKQDEKILLICVNDAPYYHLPGGHIEVGESSEAAVIREIQEEVGIEVALQKLVLMNEQFYNKDGIDNHSLVLYYLAKPQNNISTQSSVRMEEGPTKIIKNELRWVTYEELKDIDLRPLLVKNLILHNDLENLRHVIG